MSLKNPLILSCLDIALSATLFKVLGLAMSNIPSATSCKKSFFGLYIHIPFCIQICPYCPFAKYKIGTTLSKKDYIVLLKQEMHSMAQRFRQRPLSSIYFGGGTPSILTSTEILDLIAETEKAGFCHNQLREITVEVDPKTMKDPLNDLYLLKKGGVHRISLGVQTCNDRLLAKIGRTHRATDIHTTITALHHVGLSFSMDLLFGLPHQSQKELKEDIQKFLDYRPSHISTYLLEVSAKNKLSKGRPSEDVQAQMFEDIEDALQKNGFDHYELSNYARHGCQSQHNLLYWNDHPYLGLGLGSHSYLTPDMLPSRWGLRCWNPRSMSKYKDWVEDLDSYKDFDVIKPARDREYLQKHQSLTDFCHTRLRTRRGLDRHALVFKYGEDTGQVVWEHITILRKRGLLDIINNERQVALSKKGQLLSNLVFQELTFINEDCLSKTISQKTKY